MKIKSLTAGACALAIIFFLAGSISCAEEPGRAREIGELLRGALSPEKIEVALSEDGKRAWAECVGASIDGLRIDSMRLEAELSESEGSDLASQIVSSRGEIVLREDDVNKYFASGNGGGGFSDLRFKFRPEGYKAAGKFSTEALVVKIELDLTAEGRLGLKSDGVYLEDTVLYASGARQSDGITDFVVGKVNPLLPFDKIPFPTTFTEITMKEGEITLTGRPEKFRGANIWRWQK